MEQAQEAAAAHDPELAGRRAFLLASLAGVATSLVPSPANAAQSRDAEKTNARIVTDFCAAVSKRDPAAVRPFFADDLVYRMTETTPPIVGVEAVLEAFRKFGGNATSVEFRVLETLAAGPIVINRRIDRFVSPQPFTWEGVGVFFVKDGKIKEWSDYTIRMERA